MYINTGIDIVEVDKIKTAILKSDNFILRFFGVSEIEIFEQRKSNLSRYYQTIASHFSAKEAFSKAISTGVRGFALKDVQIIRDELGAPILILCDELKNKYCDYTFSISISHIELYATAVVVAYKP